MKETRVLENESLVFVLGTETGSTERGMGLVG